MTPASPIAAQYDAAAARFKALAHPVRVQILDMLRDGEVCVCHLEAALDKRQAYISQQLMVLRDAGLVESRKEGLSVFYRLVDSATRDVLGALFGPTEGHAPEPLAACLCPRCAESAKDAVKLA
jgi:DNA-binding transcriptional ArsR family regulator